MTEQTFTITHVINEIASMKKNSDTLVASIAETIINHRSQEAETHLTVDDLTMPDINALLALAGFGPEERKVVFTQVKKNREASEKLANDMLEKLKKQK